MKNPLITLTNKLRCLIGWHRWMTEKEKRENRIAAIMDIELNIFTGEHNIKATTNFKICKHCRKIKR